METVKSGLLEYGVAVQALPGESQCGDAYLVKERERGTLLAVVDGLGHGVEAAEAAETAVETLDGASTQNALTLVEQCHAALASTRGVVMSLALFDFPDRTMTWLGVGNVDGLLIRADVRHGPGREGLLMRGGVVGGKLPDLRATVLPVFPGDTVVFWTDGIAPIPGDGFDFAGPLQETARRIMARYGKKTDDALVLVARYAGDD